MSQHKAAKELFAKNAELAASNSSLMLLHKIDQLVLSSITDTSTVLQRIAEAVACDSGFPFAMVYLKNLRKRVLEPKALAIETETDAEPELLVTLRNQPVPLRHTTNPMTRAVKNFFIVTSSHLFEVVQPSLEITDAEQLQDDLGMETFFMCPLLVRGEVLGVMVLGTPHSLAQLSFHQQSLLERLTAAVGVALDNTLLYAQTQEAARRLKIANRHLKELDEAKDEFISMASHQLRTPLTSIKGYVSMLMEGDAGPVSTIQHEFLGYAYNGAQRMVSLISDLLNVSRMSAGKFLIEKAPVNLDAIVAEEVAQLQQHAASKKLMLRYVKPKKALPIANLDEGKTRQVIMNFLDNALYYTKKGTITVRLKQAGQSLELRITDTGIGVPEKAQAHLFTKFYRAANAQVMRPDGTGLGLFLAKRVVEDQGGTIIFDSIEGRGSTFGFKIPLT